MSPCSSPATASSSSAATRTARESAAAAERLIWNCRVSPSVAGSEVSAVMLTVGLTLVISKR